MFVWVGLQLNQRGHNNIGRTLSLGNHDVLEQRGLASVITQAAWLIWFISNICHRLQCDIECCASCITPLRLEGLGSFI